MLYRQLQHFFETELLGVVKWQDCQHDAPTKEEKIRGQESISFGKFNEVVTVRFGDCSITLESPSQAPPLGRVTFHGGFDATIEGPIDSVTWKKIGRSIKETITEGAKDEYSVQL